MLVQEAQQMSMSLRDFQQGSLSTLQQCAAVYHTNNLALLCDLYSFMMAADGLGLLQR
jgi:hypothetical protein